MQNINILASEIETSWKPILIELCQKHDNINKFLKDEYEKYHECLDILPKSDLIFNAFKHFNIDELKVVILGQDAYPNKEDPMGILGYKEEITTIFNQYFQRN